MKGLKITDNELSCFIEDAILNEDDTYSQINGDLINGFIVEQPKDVKDIEENGWSQLYPSLEDNNNGYKVIAGETSYGGTGFVAVKRLNTNSFKWILHLSTMNNPTKVTIENEAIRVTTDLNYPDGVDFIIPIENPEDFKIIKPAAKN